MLTNEPSEMLDKGGLLYLGGAEETSGYKGYGLSMMVEVLGGILGGGSFGKNIRMWKNTSKVANLVSSYVMKFLLMKVVCIIMVTILLPRQ